MKIKNAWHVVTRAVAGAGRRAKHSSPTIMTVAGVGALVAAGVLAVRATPRMTKVNNDLQTSLDIAERKFLDVDVIMPDDEHDYMKAKVNIWMYYGVDIAKVYGLSVALGSLGVLGILYSHGMMQRREASLVAAYGVLERSINAYRARVRESFGEEVENEINNGNFIKITDYDTKTGVAKFDAVKSEHNADQYQFEFGPSNPHWNEVRPESNLVFLRAQQRYANDLLELNGVVMLNEVFDMLKLPRTQEGAITGWARGGKGDDLIDFGLFDPNSPEEDDFFHYWNGNFPILLEFNVDPGLAYEYIGLMSPRERREAAEDKALEDYKRELAERKNRR